MTKRIEVNYGPHDGYTWVQVGCPSCGNVRLLPVAPDEDPPFCIHHSGEYSWREPSAATQADPRFAWTRMVRVKVFVDA